MEILVFGEIPRNSAGNGTAELNGGINPAQVIENRAIRCCGENCRFGFWMWGGIVEW